MPYPESLRDGADQDFACKVLQDLVFGELIQLIKVQLAEELGAEMRIFCRGPGPQTEYAF